jgi:hypothetical protein
MKQNYCYRYWKKQIINGKNVAQGLSLSSSPNVSLLYNDPFLNCASFLLHNIGEIRGLENFFLPLIMEEEHLPNHFLGFILDGAKGHASIVEVMRKDKVHQILDLGLTVN